MTDPFILLVEDNPTDEALTRRVLRKSRVLNEIVVTRDGAEALDFLFARGPFADRQPADLPHVVLLDLNLPKVSGLEVLREIRAHELTRYLPVVILTSSSEDVDLAAGYQEGANGYVVKPVEFREFHEKVGQLGLYWMLVNSGPHRPEPLPPPADGTAHAR